MPEKAKSEAKQNLIQFKVFSLDSPDCTSCAMFYFASTRAESGCCLEELQLAAKA